MEKFEFLESEFDVDTVEVDSVLVWEDGERTFREYGNGFMVRVVERGIDTSDKFIMVEGFGDVIVGAEVKGVNLIADIGS